MTTQQNKTIATELIKALSAGDADAIKRIVAEDCKWWVMGFPRDRALTRDQRVRTRALIDNKGFVAQVFGREPGLSTPWNDWREVRMALVYRLSSLSITTLGPSGSPRCAHFG